MIACICRNFSVADVTNALSDADGTVDVKTVYAACSGGEGFNCGQCRPTITELVDDHNTKRAIVAGLAESAVLPASPVNRPV